MVIPGEWRALVGLSGTHLVGRVLFEAFAIWLGCAANPQFSDISVEILGGGVDAVTSPHCMEQDTPRWGA